MTNKLFSRRLNEELDDIGMPQRTEDRIELFSKFSKLSKFQAESVLNGNLIPEEPVLKFLAQELEVSLAWLLGETEIKN